MIEQLIMKFFKRSLLLILLSSLFLAGCAEESGFSVGKYNKEDEQQETMEDDLNKQETINDGSNSGATGSGSNDKDKEDVQIKDDDSGSGLVGPVVEDNDTQAIDLGSKITTFVFTFVKSDEDNYVNVTFEKDPFDDKYNFSYYTVNDVKLDNSDYHLKEMVDDAVTYKIYLGSNESGTYVLKFYNQENTLYGKVNVEVKAKNTNTGTPYIAIAFNLIQIRIVSLSFSIQNVFKKIGNFFSNLFNADRMSLSN